MKKHKSNLKLPRLLVFIASFSYNPYWHVVYDAMGSLGAAWGVNGTPETFLLNPDGVIVYRHLGALNE